MPSPTCVTRHLPDDGLFELRLPRKDEHWQVRALAMGLLCIRVGAASAFRPRNLDFAFIKTHRSFVFSLEIVRPNRSRPCWIRRRPQFGEHPEDFRRAAF
jgi:hypothetical protein